MFPKNGSELDKSGEMIAKIHNVGVRVSFRILNRGSKKFFGKQEKLMEDLY